MTATRRTALLESSLLACKEEFLQALVRGWMGLAQLNAKSWPRAKDVQALASHLASENASIDWARVHQRQEDSVLAPDELPPAGVLPSHWGIDRALYGLVKNKRVTLASLEETLKHSDDGRRGGDDDGEVSTDEDEDAIGSPAPAESLLPSVAVDVGKPPSETGPAPREYVPRVLQEQLTGPRAPSSASQSRAADGDDVALSKPRTIATSFQAPTAPVVSAMQLRAVQCQPPEAEDPENEKTYQEMLAEIFEEYGFELQDPSEEDIVLDNDNLPTVILVGNGTIKLHGWDHRPCYGFPQGKAIYWPLTHIPLRWMPDVRKLMATTYDIAEALASHTTCIEGGPFCECFSIGIHVKLGDLYMNLVHRAPNKVQLIPFAAIDCEQTLRVTDNYWAELTVGEVEGDILIFKDLKILLEICITPAFKSIPPASPKKDAPGDGPKKDAPGDGATATRHTFAPPGGVSAPRTRGGAAVTKACPRKAPIKHRELYLEWLRGTKWHTKTETGVIRHLGKYGRFKKLKELLAAVDFIADMIRDTAFTDAEADPIIQFKLTPMGVFADFLNHGEEWVNSCLIIKRKMPLCGHMSFVKKAIRKAKKHGLGMSTVHEIINAALGTSRKRKRAEAEISDSEGEEEGRDDPMAEDEAEDEDDDDDEDDDEDEDEDEDGDEDDEDDEFPSWGGLEK
ncbi:hypothetical protein LXA43DRAFT_1063077 [Ganoderma leucocontextum]|nr:hypothetical protein LXA43DRAFT_1063077 [Ganoderma leucocontextum]